VHAVDQIAKTAVLYAATGDHVEAMDLLLDRGIDVNARYNHRLTALMWAAGSGAAASVKRLLERGADRTLEDDRGKTAAVIARETRHAEVAELLAKPM
jgi:ankyrin repeat protein